MTAIAHDRAAASFGESVAEAFANLAAQRQRSALALLGVLIGTASIVAMLTVGHMAQRETLRLFADMGVDIVQIQGAPIGEAPAALDRATIEAMPRLDPAVIASAPLALGRLPVGGGGKSADLGVAASTPALVDLTGLRVATGRFLTPMDEGGLVAVVGAGAADKLSDVGAPFTVGGKLRIRDYVFTAVGVLKPIGFTALDPMDFNDAVIIPLASARRAIDAPEPNTAMLKLRPEADAKAVGDRAIARLATPTAQLRAQSARDMIKTMNAQKAVHSRLLTAIGAISLLVGGIGVMHVMPMGVLERRREIGLRMAIGATARDVQLMFLVEAAALALVGGAAGLAFGLVAALVFAKTSGWAFSLPLYVLPLGPGMAALVGMAFGLYPAVKASRLDPIEALRAE